MIINIGKQTSIQPLKEVTPSTAGDVTVNPDDGYDAIKKVIVKKSDGGGPTITLTDGVLRIE